MSNGNKPTKEFLSIINEKDIFFHYYNLVKINTNMYNEDYEFKNYNLNYNLYNFYNYFLYFIVKITKDNKNNIRTTLLKQRLLKKIRGRILFFHNRMLYSLHKISNSKNNNILARV